MNTFSWYDAKSVKEALKQVNATVSELIQPDAPESSAVIKSGGIDLLDLMKEGLAKPSKVINIRNVEGLDGISYHSKNGLRMGANVTLSRIEKDKTIREKYLALHQAVAHAGTPHLRNMASLGGNLAQRTRCWYFRSADHQCFRKGSGTCFARIGENGQHAIMENSACASVHASSVSTALMAFGAMIEVQSEGARRMVPMKDFFVLPTVDSTRENILEANELITAVVLPPPSSGTRSYYIKQGQRESYDWALADVAVVLEMSGSTCEKAAVVLGAAAPVPIHSEAAEKALTGKTVSEKTAMGAAEASMSPATPLSKNAYKVPMFKAIVKRAILSA